MQDVPIMTIVLSSVDLPTILHLHASQNRSRTAAKKSGDGVRVRTKGHFISDAFWSWKIEADGGDKNLICNFTHRHTRIWIGNSRFALRRSKVDLASPLRQKKAVIVLQVTTLTGSTTIWNNYLIFFPFSGASLGRADGRDGEHADPPLRGRAPPAILQRHDGHLLQGQVHRSVGHGE